MFDQLTVGVVGNCASGKTTLVTGLKSRGISAINIPQEHSAAPRLWRKLGVDFLVALSCNLQTAKRRRDIPWGQERLDAQAMRLANAKAHCQLDLPTDDLTIEQVLETVVLAIEKTKKEHADGRKDHPGGVETSPEGRDVHPLRS